MNIVILLLLALLGMVSPLCLGAPMKAFGGRNFNCFSLCCAPGFVQDVITGTNCVSCDSVGQIQCASCTLFFRSEAEGNVYKCMSAKNINQLVTVGTTSQCTNPSGKTEENTFVLSNWTNFDQCLSCNSIIPNAQTCAISYTCALTVANNTGNNCSPKIKVLKCLDGYGPVNGDSTVCDSCAVMSGCILCQNTTTCSVCDTSRNYTLNPTTKVCQCSPGTTCLTCAHNQVLDNSTYTCKCRFGYTNQSGTCVKTAPCPNPYEVFNPINSSCQCVLGYVRNSAGSCVELQCGTNFEVSPRGLCICKNGLTLVGSQCVYLAKYRARTTSYNVDVLPNNITYLNTAEYKCGCPAGFVYSNLSCIPCSPSNMNCPCPETTILINGTCQPCSTIDQSNCFSCQILPPVFPYSRTTNCTRCLPGFYLYKFVSGFYGCYPCQQIVGCTQCNDNFDTPLGKRFCSQCQISWTSTDASGQCTPCTFIGNCINCIYDPLVRDGFCITCKAPYVLGNKNQVCNCPSPLTNGSCIPCHQGCQTCLGTTCIQCRPEFILNSAGACDCPSRSLDTSAYCENCKDDLMGTNIQGCSACLSAKACALCVSGYLLIGEGACEKCSRYIPGCLECTNNSTCTVCDAGLGYKVVSGQCVCQSGLISYNGCNNCSILINGCNQCANYTTCLQCNTENNYELHGNTCICQAATYRSDIFQCASCALGCLNCTSLTSCSLCKDNFTLPNGTCLCKTQNYVVANNGCFLCSDVFGSACTRCNNQTCFNCVGHFHLEGPNCVVNPCQDFACTKCDEKGICIECNPTATLVAGGLCYCNRMNGIYANLTTNNCEQCSNYPLCRQCMNSTLCQDCTRFTSDVVLFPTGECRCKNGTYYDGLSCQSCDIDNCAICLDFLKCKTCVDGYDYAAQGYACNKKWS